MSTAIGQIGTGLCWSIEILATVFGQQQQQQFQPTAPQFNQLSGLSTIHLYDHFVSSLLSVFFPFSAKLLFFFYDTHDLFLQVDVNDATTCASFSWIEIVTAKNLYTCNNKIRKDKIITVRIKITFLRLDIFSFQFSRQEPPLRFRLSVFPYKCGLDSSPGARAGPDHIKSPLE